MAPAHPLLHLQPLGLTDLPPHPALAPPGGAPADTASTLLTFIKEILDEAAVLVDSLGDASTFKLESEKSSSPSQAKVKVLSRELGAQEVSRDQKTHAAGGKISGNPRAETWFARRSKHQAKREKGTADWKEFEDGLLKDHSQHEMEYTPGVFDAHSVLDWRDEIRQAESSGARVEGWEVVDMKVMEMCHHLPFPLLNRVFPILIISGTSTTSSNFTIAQIPINFSGFPVTFTTSNVLYCNGRHKKVGDTPRKKKGVVVGQYVSVESARVETEAEGELVAWDMATASDAKGWLPKPLQKMGVPGAVVKDVGFFMDWTAKRRAGLT